MKVVLDRSYLEFVVISYLMYKLRQGLFPAQYNTQLRSLGRYLVPSFLTVTSIKKEGEGATDAQPSLGGGDTKARQQKARRKMQHLIYF